MSKGGHFLAQQPKKKTKTWVVVVAVILAVILLLGALAAWFVVSKMNKINRADRGDNQLSAEDIGKYMIEGTTAPTEATTVPTTEATTAPTEETKPDYGKLGKIVNFLLIGQDARPGEDSKNSDTVLLVSVNKETKKITMISFLRDSVVVIPKVYDTYGNEHSGQTKLTLAYAMGYKWGGDLGAMEIMDQVIERNFGAVVDYNVEINLDAFDAIINAVGYITADLDENEAAYMNEKFKDYPDRNYSVGENRLDGWAAEEYARMRHSDNADNDYKRTARQRTVVSQVLERVKGMNVVQINALVDELLDKVLTDMTNSDITTCITELLPLLPEMTMDSLQCPNADMDLSGKLIDLFKDGSPEQSIQTFTESKARQLSLPLPRTIEWFAPPGGENPSGGLFLGGSNEQSADVSNPAGKIQNYQVHCPAAWLPHPGGTAGGGGGFRRRSGRTAWGGSGGKGQRGAIRG